MFGRKLLNGIVDNLAALGVATHDELGVGTLGENVAGLGCPVRTMSASVLIIHRNVARRLRHIAEETYIALLPAASPPAK